MWHIESNTKIHRIKILKWFFWNLDRLVRMSEYQVVGLRCMNTTSYTPWLRLSKGLQHFYHKSHTNIKRQLPPALWLSSGQPLVFFLSSCLLWILSNSLGLGWSTSVEVYFCNTFHLVINKRFPSHLSVC